MNNLESCMPTLSEAYPLIREGREAGARSAVEWEGDSWACVWMGTLLSQEGKVLAPLPREGMGGVRGCLCVRASALPADSGYSLHLMNLGVGDQKHTCLPVYATHAYRGNIQDTALPQQVQSIQPGGQDTGPGLCPDFKCQLCLLLIFYLLCDLRQITFLLCASVSSSGEEG